MDIRQFLLILRARLAIALAVLAVTVGATVAVSLLLPKQYTATASIVVDPKGYDPVGGTMLPMQMLPGYLATQIDIIMSQSVALRVVQMLRLAESPELRRQFEKDGEGKGSFPHWVADSMRNSLDVKPARESSMINIDYRASDPKFAATAANAFAQAYIDTALQLKVEPARQTAVWFDAQMKTLRDNLEQAQVKLSAYQRETGIVSADEKFDVEGMRLAELSQQLVLTQGQALESRSRARKAAELAAAGRGPLDQLSDVLNMPLITSLKVELTRVEAKLREMESQLGHNHPQYIQTRAQAAEIRARLDTEVSNVIESLRNTETINDRREAELRAAVARQKERVLQIKKQRDELAVLMREVEAAQKAFDVAMARYAQTSLEGQNKQVNVSLLNPAVEPARHSSPKLMLNVVFSILLGSVLAMGLAFALEAVDTRIRGADHMRALFEAPLLGVFANERRRRMPFLPALRRAPATPLLGASR